MSKCCAFHRTKKQTNERTIGDWVLAKIAKYEYAYDANGDKSDDSSIENYFDAPIDDYFNHVWPFQNEKPCGVQNVQSHCDVIADVISVQNTLSGIICHDLLIYGVKMNLS